MDGIIIINKPKGCTSHDIVYKMKKITGEKVGHTGTLDPNATGVLPLLIGKGTLLSKYLINHDKTYQVTLKLGEKTDTADIEGEIIEKKIVDNKILEIDTVEKVLNSFIGNQEQIPPIYSAIKVNGKKLYEYARSGKEVTIEPRKISIYSIKLLSINIENKEITFEVSCSKGTYIRSLCEDIAQKLNTVGYMKKLNRIQVGEFFIENSITIEDFEQNINNTEYLNNHLITIEMLFKDREAIMLDKSKLRLFLNGVKLSCKLEDGVYKIYNSHKGFIGTGIIKNNTLKRDIIVKNIENV